MNLTSGNLPKSLPAFQLNSSINDTGLYILDSGMQAAVEVALTLGQPLLLTGEPGVGKSQLAYYVAHHYNLDQPELVAVQTTSVAKDLFYRYDALGHFQYSQHEKKPLTEGLIESKFIRYQGIGAAIKSRKRKVVLIDEIDKAPRDLPNDILTALDRMSFEVPEIGKIYIGEKTEPPIVIITSNSEKNLPDPFLRRIVYYHIPFPSDENLITILVSKLYGAKQADKGNLKLLIDYFNTLRSDSFRLRKKPSTSELLLWADLLIRKNFAFENLKNPIALVDEQKAILKQSYSVLAKTQEDLQLLYNKLGE